MPVYNVDKIIVDNYSFRSFNIQGRSLKIAARLKISAYLNNQQKYFYMYYVKHVVDSELIFTVYSSNSPAITKYYDNFANDLTIINQMRSVAHVYPLQLELKSDGRFYLYGKIYSFPDI